MENEEEINGARPQVEAINEPLYKKSDFDYESVKTNSKLCAMVDSNGGIVGTGIPKMKGSDNITVTIDGESYSFDSNGNPLSSNAKSKGYSLNMAESQMKANNTGTIGGTKKAFTRSVNPETGEVTYTPSEILDKTYEITIESLNARDQFAIQALHGILNKIPDPSTLSKDEITYYCEAAYQWASYMMTESSKARSVIDDSESSSNTKTETVGYLESNTEKLLNNIVAAIERNDIKETVDGKEIFSDRIDIPKLLEFLDTYISHTETPEQGDPVTTKYGLFDLIKAIQDINVDVSTDDLVAAIQNQGKDAEHPIYISGGGFPSRDVLAAAFTEANIHDFLTFNAAGAVGYSTKDEVKKAILGYLNNYSTLSALSTAVLGELTADAIYNKIQSKVDDRIKAWLQAARVTIGENTYSLTVNTPT